MITQDVQLQYRCDGCGRYTHPVGADEAPQSGFADGYVPGCWTATGALCPDCRPEYGAADGR